MAVGDIYEVKLFTQQGPQMGLMVFHYRVSAISAPEATVDQIAAAMEGSFASLVKAVMTAQADFRGASARKVRPLPIGVEFLTGNFPGPGTIGGDPLPPQVSGIITLRSALAGRANRGRKYVPFPAEASNDTGFAPTAAYLTVMTNLANEFDDMQNVPNGAGSSDLTPVIFHRLLGTTTDVTFALVRNAWATQRRRGAYGRPNVAPV